MTNNTQNITAILPTRSRDLTLLKKATHSILWVDDILIADSSKNKKGSIKVKKFAHEIGARYVYREYKYSANFKNWVISQVKSEWILLLDSDEIVTKKLQQYIKYLFKSGEINKYDGFGIARKHFFFGKFLKHGGRYPLYNVRLFRKHCRYEHRNVHAHIIMPTNRLYNINPKYGDILHYSDRNFDQFFERFNRYSDYQAKYILKMSQKNNSINLRQFLTNFLYFKAIVKDVWYFIPGYSLWRFIWMYFIKLGFLDGSAGFKIAILYAFQDFVSKTKYYHLLGKNYDWREKYQEIFIFIIARLFNNHKEFIIQYNNFLFASHNKLQIIKINN